MKRFLKSFRGEKGFTLLELLIVVAILGILAAVLVPNLASFIGTGTVAAANTEAANVETAALAFYADHDGTWPDDSDDLYDSAALPNSYLSDEPRAVYTFGAASYGKITAADATVAAIPWTGIKWDGTKHKWVKDTT